MTTYQERVEALQASHAARVAVMRAEHEQATNDMLSTHEANVAAVDAWFEENRVKEMPAFELDTVECTHVGESTTGEHQTQNCLRVVLETSAQVVHQQFMTQQSLQQTANLAQQTFLTIL